MAGVFIAYAREDEQFARRLHDLLSSSGREPVWDQDHTAVPFGMPWRQEIREAIQNTDKFIFIISPESLASTACASELAQAVEFSKQVIPILRRMPGEGQTVPNTIDELNWILFREDAEFGRSFRQLSAVLDTDIAWTKTHTRLLGRASQWATSRDRSLLLRGSELRTAESWLGEAAEHEKTPPTRIQRDYISRSRQGADRAARRWRGALAAGLAVAIALAATALVQRDQAIGQRNQAIREARIALSGKLAANSEALDSTDPATASLLSAAAWQIFPTAQARESMLDALAQPERMIFHVSADDGVHSVAFSPDGKMLATGTFTGKIKLWTTGGRPIGVPLPGRTGINNDVTALDFSPDGKLLATASSQGVVRLWDVAAHRQTGTPMAATPSRGGVLASVAFSPDGKLLATGINDFSASRILLWDVTTHRQIGTPLPGGASLAFSPAGKILAGAGNDGSTVLWDVATHRQLGASLAATTAGPADSVISVEFSPNGKTLATANSNGAVRLWNVATRRQTGATISAGIQVKDPAALAFSLDGKTLASTDAGGHVRLWDTATHQQTGQSIATSTTCDAGISGLTFSPVTDFLATADCDGTVRLWDIALLHQDGGIIRSAPTILLFAPWFPLVFSPDGKSLATTGIEASSWDIATRRLIMAFSPNKVRHPARERAFPGRFSDSSTSISASKDWKILATASPYGVRLWDMAARRQIGGTLPSGLDGGASADGRTPLGPEAALSPDATMLATVTGDNSDARLWQVTINRQSGAPLTAAANLGHSVASVQFSPDGKTLATANINGQIRLWDIATRHPLGAPFAAGSAYMSFSPDGKLLAVGNSNSVRLWNVATHRASGAPLVTGPANSVVTAFSPDGTMAATATDEGPIQLWDMATRREIGPPLTLTDQFPYASATAMAFSPDGKMLATANPEGAIRLWNVAFPHDLLRRVCAIAGQAMTREQWDTYVSTQSFEPICSPR